MDGRFVLEHLIRHDQIYRVYRGRDLQSDTPVALWFLAEAKQAPDELQEGFLDALRIRSQHPELPHVEPVMGFGQSLAFGPYGVCPWIAGETLATFVDERGVLSVEQARAAYEQILRGVEAIAHLGLGFECPQPGKIFIGADAQQMWLLGGGLPGTRLGHAEKTRFADQAEALGQVLLWMLTGQSPSGSASLPALDGFPRGVLTFLRCCLGKPVGYGSFAELASAWRTAFDDTAGQTLALPVLESAPAPIQLRPENIRVVAPKVGNGVQHAAVAEDSLAVPDEVEENFWSRDVYTGSDWTTGRSEARKKAIAIGAGIGGVLLFVGFGYLVAGRDSAPAPGAEPGVRTMERGATSAPAPSPTEPARQIDSASAQPPTPAVDPSVANPSESPEQAEAMGEGAPTQPPLGLGGPASLAGEQAPGSEQLPTQVEATAPQKHEPEASPAANDRDQKAEVEAHELVRPAAKRVGSIKPVEAQVARKDDTERLEHKPTKSSEVVRFSSSGSLKPAAPPPKERRSGKADEGSVTRPASTGKVKKIIEENPY